MRPVLNGSSELQHFERGNVVEIHNGTMFNFYPGLPHMSNMSGWSLGMSRTDHVNHGILQGLGTVCAEEGMFPQVKLQEAADVVGVRLVHHCSPGW